MLADRLKTLAPSATLAVQAKARAMRAQGIDVISFSVGEPDFDTPERVKDAARRALTEGMTKYTEVPGIPELRAAVCQKLRRDNGLDYDPAEVLISCGAKHTLYNIFVALLNPADEVLVPSPYWVSYPEQVKLLGGVPVAVATDEESGFQVDPARLRAAVTPRAKAVVLNTPNNPTGAVFAAETLEAVARVAVERNLWIISDECYEALTYEGRHISIASLGPEVKARTIVVNTCSKAYAMTGWRIGYAAGPPALITAMSDVQSQVTANPTSIAQWAAVEALAGPQDEVAKMVGEFDRRRRIVVEGLNRIPGIRCAVPTGAFYAFPNVSALFGRRWQGRPLESSSDVAAFLLEAARVAVVPGVEFGSDRHIRISYATELPTIKEGLSRLEAAVRSLAS
ncbi:MAG: pyridoxal phosphate-dependent aminotransferase [Candidatus Rokubacteria bacterium]|nr:pyridoxal phosphate-dependent aminotransferase [Candidatus Rokubacteria bacterium]